MENLITQEELDQMIAYLQGSTSSINKFLSLLEDENGEDRNLCEDDLTQEQLDYVDDHTVLCPTCGWWNFEGLNGLKESNEHMDYVCEDCFEEDEEEDEDY